MRTWGIYLLAALGFVIYGAATDADRDGSGAIIGGGNVDAFNVRVGDCFNDYGSFNEEVTSVPGVPCSEPHDNEAYAVFDVTIDSYPEGDGMWNLANEACLDRFSAFVGMEYEHSSLDVVTLFPSPDSWKQNDREVVCAVYDMNESKLQGSMKGRAL